MTKSNDLWNRNGRSVLCFLKLNKSKSIEYRNSKDFRNYIISRVLHPKQQISLNLSWQDQIIIDVSSLGNVHELDLSICYTHDYYLCGAGT